MNDAFLKKKCIFQKMKYYSISRIFFQNTSDEFVKPVAPGQVMRRSFVKGQNGARSSPDVKVSEEQSDKSGTDPEDTDENHSQADITDYRHYEEIFRYGYYTVYL